MQKTSYLSVIKPGIIFGNLITAIGGFYLVKPYADFLLLCFTLLGVILVVASGCIFNNLIDSDIDPLMERTKFRPTALGQINERKLMLLGIVLAFAGFAELFFFTNPLTALIAFIGFFFYVIVYSLYFKRKSIFGTALGSISGAIPPVIGYCAANNTFNTGAILLFLMLVFWQMPHSYAIAIYRMKDYVAANIPVLPLKKGIPTTKISMLVHSILFFIVSLLLTYFSYTGEIYFILAFLLNGYWVYLIARGFFTVDNVSWARKVFFISIIIITLLSLLMVVN